MSLDPIEVELGEGLSSNVIDDDEPNIVNIHPSNARATWRMELANQMKWVLEKYDALVACMVNLHNVRTSNVDTGFKWKKNSGFDWDEYRQLVVAEDVSHKKVVQFKHCSFPYYDQLTSIYAKDQAIGKDAQTTADIIEEIDVEDVATTNTHEERNDFHGCEADISFYNMNLSATQPQPPRNQGVTDYLENDFDLRNLRKRVRESITHDE
ncbi:hypothetical protein Gotri_012524, partial [Gossypium trilobum]|nr:hypothetical protein [Gossypium trilobum]